MENIFKKSSILILSQAFCRVISFFYIIFIARSVGVENFGLYTVAMSYFSLLTAISDFGISRYLIREVASLRRDPKLMLSNVLLVRLTILSVTICIFSIALYLFDPLKIRVFLSLVAVLAILPSAFSLTFENLFIAKGSIRLSALGLPFFNIVNALLGIWFISAGFSVGGVILANLLAEIIYGGFSYSLFKELKVRFTKIVEPFPLKEILAGSIPYGVLGVLGLIYFKIDSILLSYLKGSFDAGIYGAAYKFLEAIVFIPSSVALVSFPQIAKMHETGSSHLKKIYRDIFKRMGLIGLIITAAYIGLTPLIINYFLPQYNSAVIVVRILSLAIPFMFLHVPLSQLLLSSDKFLGPIIKLSLANVLFNIILNILFIPQFGYMAAAWITVLSDIFSLLLLNAVIKKYLFK